MTLATTLSAPERPNVIWVMGEDMARSCRVTRGTGASRTTGRATGPPSITASTTYVVEPGPEFEILQRNPLDELCLSSPAILGDILIRTASKLYCLTEGAELDVGEKE